MNDSTGLTGAGVTGIGFASNWIVTLNDYLQAGVNAIAIIAGIATAWYYIDRTLAARRARKQK